MATAIKNKTATTYTLTLSAEEVAALSLVLINTGGQPNGPRAHIDTVLESLEAHGIVKMSQYCLAQGNIQVEDVDNKFAELVQAFQ